MKKRVLSALMFSMVLGGCNSADSPPSEPISEVGSDKDEFGCIASAGYQWCARTEVCERPWELAEKAGFENTATEFEAYCGAKEL